MDSADDIFLNAREMGDPTERAIYLNQACGADATLRKRVEDLLRDAAGAQEFFGAEDHLPGMAAAPVTEGPGTVIGRYRLLQKIGEGGMGAVYMAEQREPVVRKVALKVIKLGMDSRQVLSRFEAERQALALMDHPNIAKILDGGVTDAGRPYFVMDLVQGLPITRFCDETNLSTRERLDLFLDVCSAIQHAHQKGIIHRDIKPANLLVTWHGDKPVPKIIDFGIAKATQGRLTEKTLLTQFQHFLGTPAYMSPEQASLSGLDVDTRSDIYALGVLLYELLTGKTPFDEKELMKAGIDEMRRTIQEREPLRPSTRLSSLASEELTTTAKHRRIEAPRLISTLRGDLDWIVMKCLEKDRVRRYETANGLAVDLKRHLSNEPIIARPPSSVYRFQKALRRNKLIFAAGSAVVLTLVVGLSFSTWSFLRERKAHASETAQRRIAVEERSKARAGELASRHLLYVANMNRAQAAWEQNNLGLVRQLLEETQDSPHRGLEWFYWQRLAHLEQRTFRGHVAEVTGVAVSPDGKRIASGSLDRTAKIWEVATGRELLTVKGHSNFVFGVTFSSDGQRILTGSEDKTARLWDAVSGRGLLRLEGHTAQIETVAFSRDDRRILTGGLDKTVRLWDASTGVKLREFAGQVGALSPDGRQIVTTGGYVVVGGNHLGDEASNKATLWDAESGRELVQFKGHSDLIMWVAFSGDGNKIVTASSDHTAKVWDAASGRDLLTLKGHGDRINSAAFSEDGKRIVTGSADQTAKVWNTVTGQELLTLKGHSSALNFAIFSPDDRLIVTSSVDATSKVWDPRATRETITLDGQNPKLCGLAFSPDGKRIVTGSYSGESKVWDATTARVLFRLEGTDATFSPDGRQIVTTRGWIKLWDAESGRKLGEFAGHKDPIEGVAFSPDGQRIITCSDDKTAVVWEVSSGKELLKLIGHTDGVRGVAVSPDGQRILTGSIDGTARIWNAMTGAEMRRFREHQAEVYGVTFSPDGQRILSGDGNGIGLLWEAATGRVLLTLKGHSGTIICAAFSPDGQRILTGSGDNTAKLWETLTGREVLTFKGHMGQIMKARFSPDGQRIATASFDGMARLWDVATPEQVRVWQEEERAAAKKIEAFRREEMTRGE